MLFTTLESDRQLLSSAIHCSWVWVTAFIQCYLLLLSLIDSFYTVLFTALKFDSFHTVLFTALESDWQTLYSAIHCSWADSWHSSHMILNEWLALHSAFKCPWKWCFHSANWMWHGWCHAKLLPHMVDPKLSTPHNHVPVYSYSKPHTFIQSFCTYWIISVFPKSTELWHGPQDL